MQYLLVVGLWLTLIAFVWFFIVAGTRRIEATAEAQAQNQAQIYADLVEEFVEQTLANFDQDLLMLRDAYIARELGPDLRVWRESHHARNEVAVQYSIVDANGRLTATTGDTRSIGLDLSDRPHVRIHMASSADRAHLSVPVVGRASNRISLQLTRRIAGEAGAFGGVVVASLDAEYYDRFISRTRVRNQDVISLVGRDGTIRLRSGPVRPAGDSYAGTPLFARILKEGSGTARGIGQSDGVERFIAFRTLPEYDLIVYVGVAVHGEASILSEGIDFLRKVAWICTVLTGLSALAIVHVLKRRHEATMSRNIMGELSRRMAVIGTLLDRSDALLLAVGNDGRVHFANRRCVELFAGTASAPDGDTQIQSRLGFAVEGGSGLFFDRIRASEAAPVSFEQDILDARGEQRAFLWIWSADDKTVAGSRSFIGIAIDVTARRRSEMTAIRSEKVSSLGEIAASIVHELNQPLNVIGLACSNVRQMLGPTGPAGDVSGKLDRIEQQVGRAAGILDRLRRYISGAGGNPPSRFAVADAIRAAEEFVADQLRIDGVRVSSQVSAACFVRGDRLLFEQLAVNLLLNARDAIVSGSAEDDTEVRGEIVVNGAALDNGTHFRMTVADTGPGLSVEAAARAFEPYFTTKPVGRGTGLGLPICRTIVQSFGGEISIRNAGRGAIVEFTVLLDKDASRAVAGAAVR
jgi:signal transduction histidine kinase